MIKLQTKRIKLNLLLKLLHVYLNSNFALTLPGYLNPALNNMAQGPVVQRPINI